MESLIACVSVAVADWGVAAVQLVRFFSTLGVLVVVAVGILVWRAYARPAFPQAFDLQFAATGLVEDVAYQGDTCRVKIAIYDWINLSQGFEFSEIPSRSDRYYLRGQGEKCQALIVAMAATEQHIGFQAGRAGKAWYLIQNPTSAVGCGGMKLDWVPEPEI
jgi:hypothetical protein